MSVADGDRCMGRTGTAVLHHRRATPQQIPA